MYTIAIVDDEEQYVNSILSFLARFFGENQTLENQYTTVCYRDGKELLSEYKPKFDIIFLDIEMSEVNGFSAAKTIREKDEKTAIIFVTRMANYAIKGYEVNALDFMVKPVDYFQFSIKLKKALKYVELHRERQIKVEVNGNVRWLTASDIKYVEIQNHSLILHLSDEQLRAWCSLKSISEQLGDEGFSYCNRCYLVNLRYVTGIDKNECLLGQERLAVSRYKRKEFLAALAKFYSHKGD